MARILAIDYGTKRCGLAVTDPLQIIASGLTTVPATALLPFLKDYCAQEEVELFLVGEPKRHDNSPSQVEVYIADFIKQLTKELPHIPIKRVDERFTSKMAVQAMIAGGMKKKQRQDKALVDKISATLILQTYLEEQAY